MGGKGEGGGECEEIRRANLMLWRKGKKEEDRQRVALVQKIKKNLAQLHPGKLEWNRQGGLLRKPQSEN